MPKERGDVVLIEVDGQSIHGQLLACAVYLAQVAHCHTHLQACGLGLHIAVVFCKQRNTLNSTENEVICWLVIGWLLNVPATCYCVS